MTASMLGRAKTVTAVEMLARSDRRVAATVDQWDADPWAFNTPGGIVDLRTGKTGPCDPLKYCTKIAAAAPSQIIDCPTSTDSFVIEAVTVKPFTSIRTCEVVAPILTSLTVPSRTLRAEIFMCLASSLGFSTYK
jgi:hypothetical protein